MGEAGQIIQWILQLGPLVESLIKDLIEAIKGGKTPASLTSLAWLAPALSMCEGILSLLEKVHIIFRGPAMDEAIVVLKALIAALTELQGLAVPTVVK